MQVVIPQLISGKKVLLRYDIDVALENGQVMEDFKLRAGLETLKLCLQKASKVVLMGHVGRPAGKLVPDLSVKPIREWFGSQGYENDLRTGKLVILENLRFDPREEAADPEYAKNLAAMGEFYVNEAFSSYHPAVSTTVLPTLLPHAAGLRFAKEVESLLGVRNNPKKPFVAVMGGAKVADKLPVIKVLAEKADAVLVGGKLVAEIKDENIQLPANVMVGKLNEDGFDIAAETVESWANMIKSAKMIVWNGPVGKFEDPKYDGTAKVAGMILDSSAEIVIGGGDTVAALNACGLLEKAFSASESEREDAKMKSSVFISVGGGAMLKLMADGTLPTIEVLS